MAQVPCLFNLSLRALFMAALTQVQATPSREKQGVGFHKTFDIKKSSACKIPFLTLK